MTDYVSIWWDNIHYPFILHKYLLCFHRVSLYVVWNWTASWGQIEICNMLGKQVLFMWSELLKIYLGQVCEPNGGWHIHHRAARFQFQRRSSLMWQCYRPWNKVWKNGKICKMQLARNHESQESQYIKNCTSHLRLSVINHWVIVVFGHFNIMS